MTKKKESENPKRMDEFNVEMKKIKSDRYEFVLENPRDAEGWEAASQDFIDRVGMDDDIFEYSTLMDALMESKQIGKVQILCGTYEHGYDVELMWVKVNTEDYKTYTVEFEIFSGEPFEDFKKVLKSIS